MIGDLQVLQPKNPMRVRLWEGDPDTYLYHTAITDPISFITVDPGTCPYTLWSLFSVAGCEDPGSSGAIRVQCAFPPIASLSAASCVSAFGLSGRQYIGSFHPLDIDWFKDAYEPRITPSLCGEVCDSKVHVTAYTDSNQPLYKDFGSIV